VIYPPTRIPTRRFSKRISSHVPGAICSDGKYPYAGLIQGSDGSFYGTTIVGGGANVPCPWNGEDLGCGTIFKITPGEGLTTLHNFCSPSYCLDGAFPYAGLVQGGDGNFYGTTLGGDNAKGTVFRITPSGTLTSLHWFCSQKSPAGNCLDGQNLYAGLVQGSDGNLYGTTANGGAYGNGEVFGITPSGVLSVIHSFSGGADGGNPYTGLIQGSDGNFYGMTYSGGANGQGTVFKLALVPVAGLSPSALSFGNQVIGSTGQPQKVTLSNTGAAPLAISGIATSRDFAQTNNCGGSVPAFGSCTISVTFAPAAAGTEVGALTLTDNSNVIDGSQQIISLTGTGTAPMARLSPVSLSFGPQPINTPSPPGGITLANSYVGPLTLANISITGDNAGDFRETSDCPSNLAANAKCTINVTFAPSTLAGEIATLNVNDNASNSPQTVALTGTGVTQVAVRPASLVFAEPIVGTPSGAKNVVLTNNLSTPLAINITFTGADPADFTETDTCAGSLAARSHCTISVTFTPAATGTRTATLNVNDSANNSPQTVSLTGAGK